MGRPKGSKNGKKQVSDEAKEIAESGETAENVVELKPAKEPKVSAQSPQLSDAQYQSLLLQSQSDYNKSLTSKKRTDADFKNVCKRIKAECGKDAIDDIKELNLLETDEGEAKIKAKVERTIRNATYVGAKLGEQLRLFSSADGVPLGMRAYEAGKRAGIKGDPCKPPHSPGNQEYDSWMSGWQDGNTELAGKTFKKPTFRDVADEGDRLIHETVSGRPPSYEVIN